MLVAKPKQITYSYAFVNNNTLYAKIKVYLKKSCFAWQKEGFLWNLK